MSRLTQGGELGFGGEVCGRLISPVSLGWKVRNLPNRLRALPALLTHRAIGARVGLVMAHSELSARYILPGSAYREQAASLGDLRAVRERLVAIAQDVLRGKTPGHVLDYGVVSERMVTTVGVNALTDAFQGIFTLSNFKFHASGTSATAEAVGDTALIAEATTITDRATGSQTEGASANIYKTVGTQSYTGSATIQEHGIFSVVTESTGVLWDRSLTGGQAVVAGSAIEWTYSLTVTAGG